MACIALYLLFWDKWHATSVKRVVRKKLLRGKGSNYNTKNNYFPIHLNIYSYHSIFIFRIFDWQTGCSSAFNSFVVVFLLG